MSNEYDELKSGLESYLDRHGDADMVMQMKLDRLVRLAYDRGFYEAATGDEWPEPAVTPLKGQPDVVDEITWGKGFNSVHLERMDKHYYFLRVGQKPFSLKSAVFKGPGIVVRSDD